MKPIENTTETYTRAQHNITKTINEIEKTYEYFRYASDVEPVINQGMGSYPHQPFFTSYKKLHDAKKFFEEHKRDIKSSSTALVYIDNLITRAINKIGDHLTEQLNSIGKSIKLEDDLKYKAYNPIENESVIKEINGLFGILEANEIKIHYHIYESVRVELCLSIVKELYNTHSNEWARLSQDVPYTSGNHPLEKVLELTIELIQGELGLWNLLLASTDEAVLLYTTICDALLSEVQTMIAPIFLIEYDYNSPNLVLRQSNSFLIRMDVFVTLTNYYDDLHDLSRSDSKTENIASEKVASIRKICLEGCIESINHLLVAANNCGLTNKSIANNDLSSDLHPTTGNIIYCCKNMTRFATAYNTLYSLSNELGQSLENSFPTEAPTLSELIHNLITNTLSNIDKSSEIFDVKNEKGVRSIEVGAAVRKRTININKHALYDANDTNKEAVDHISGCRKYLFLVNNLFCIYIYLREKKKEIRGSVSTTKERSNSVNSSSNQTIVGINDPHVVEELIVNVEGLLSKSQVSFAEAVAKSVSMSSSDSIEFIALHKENKNNTAHVYRLLKAKFSTFNSGIDALLTQKGEWRISATGLRDLITNQLVEAIVPLYTEFYKKYSTIHFSKKHMAEYIKYSPEVIEKLLLSFFGVANNH